MVSIDIVLLRTNNNYIQKELVYLNTWIGFSKLLIASYLQTIGINSMCM